MYMIKYSVTRCCILVVGRVVVQVGGDEGKIKGGEREREREGEDKGRHDERLGENKGIQRRDAGV